MENQSATQTCFPVWGSKKIDSWPHRTSHCNVDFMRFSPLNHPLPRKKLIDHVPIPLIIESTHHSSLPLNTANLPNNHADPNATNHWRAKALELAMRTLKRPLLEPQQTCSPCAKAALASCARQKVFILKFGLQQNEGAWTQADVSTIYLQEFTSRCSPVGKCSLCRLFLTYKRTELSTFATWAKSSCYM